MSRAPRPAWLSFGLAILSLAVVVPVYAAPPRDAGLPAPPPLLEDGSTSTGGEQELPGVGDTGLGLTPDEAQALLEAQQEEQEFRDALDKAERAERAKRWGEAVRAYQAALRIHEDDPAVLQKLGHARRSNTKPGICPRQAIENLLLLEVYDPRNLWLSERGNALLWMSDCGDAYAKEQFQLAEELAALPRGRVGRPDEVRVVVATLLWRGMDRDKRPEQVRALQQIRQQLRAYLAECEGAETVPVADALYLLGEVERERGDLDEAVKAFRRFVETHPEDRRKGPAEDLIEELEIRLTVERLEEAQGGLPTPAAEEAYRRGVEALRTGNANLAMTELEAAVKESPWFPEAQYQLGQAYAKRNRDQQAIAALKRAAAMEPTNHAAHLALGMLYYKRFNRAEDDRAREHLERALSLRQDLHTLHYYLGELYTAKDREAAREHYEAFIEEASRDDPLLAKARNALRDLERDAVEEEPVIVPAPPRAELRRLDPELQRLINEAYVVGSEHKDWNRAEKVLLRAPEQFRREPALLNELAKVVVAQGREGDARTYWEESLAQDDDQVEVHERLGLLIADPDQANYHLQRAAELGSSTARFELAHSLWQRYRLWEASEQLDLYLTSAGPYDLRWEHANALRERIDKVLRQLYMASGVVTFVLLAFPLFRIYRRLRGASLTQLLDRAPKSYPEVARILSLIRHEILKHNTAFLADVGHALETDAPDADARAALLARRLFGSDDPGHATQSERRGIYGRFLGYCEELERVARSHGVTLNLGRKDATFAAMLRAFDDVARRSVWLRMTGRLRAGRRLELARVLNRSGDVLGRRAFERLSGLIEKLCVVDVDGSIVRGVYERVVAESQFAGLDVAPMEVSGDGAPIRMFQTDFEDVLTNVLRNSLSSSALYATPPITLSVHLDREIDDITGLETLAVRVKDRSPERLTNEMLRGRYVERGMGITADLLSRYDGSIAVESEPGWEKSVVLRFFTVEEHT